MKIAIEVEVCDTCEDMKRPVKEYTVSADGKTAKKTLCLVHARPLEVVLGNAKPVGRPTAKKAASRVTSIKEIDKNKTAKKAVAKKA
jgi:hypothetical protein